MDPAPERIVRLFEPARSPAGQTVAKPTPVPVPSTWPLLEEASAASGPIGAHRDGMRNALLATRWAILMYLGSRALLVLVAALEGHLRHQPLTSELANWDGLWYARLASSGYPAYASHLHTTLGFFPLYPLLVRGLADVLGWLSPSSNLLWLIDLAGVIVSGLGGLVTVVLAQRLAAGWWGERAARRAVAFFCLFPGSVVFSMVYAEGLMLPLAAGCILALQRRRWLTAGILAGLATATEPEGVVLVLVCATSAALHLRRTGRLTRERCRCLVAPLLSLTGVGAFAVFLWLRTGTPFATMIAQRYAWHESFDPLALLHLAWTLEWRLGHPDAHTSLYNPLGAVAGAAVLAIGLLMLFARRRTVSLEALVWTLGIAFIAATSSRLLPNSRVLITAFPVVLVIGSCVRGRSFWVLQSLNVLLFIAASWLTFISHLLPP